MLLVDDETRSWWDHITGEAVHGELVGAVLDSWPLHYLTVAEASQRWPDLSANERQTSLKHRALNLAMGRGIRGARGFLPPLFRGTMAEVDPRLPEQTPGLAVVVGEVARFYPMSEVAAGTEDVLGGRSLRVESNAGGFAEATWTDSAGGRPMQLMMRWYGFILTWPRGDIGGATGSS